MEMKTFLCKNNFNQNCLVAACCAETAAQLATFSAINNFGIDLNELEWKVFDLSVVLKKPEVLGWVD